MSHFPAGTPGWPSSEDGQLIFLPLPAPRTSRCFPVTPWGDRSAVFSPPEFHPGRGARLLLDVIPEVFRSGVFAMKGGTAINLFVQDLPCLSVDIDVVYLPQEKPCEAAPAECLTS